MNCYMMVLPRCQRMILGRCQYLDLMSGACLVEQEGVVLLLLSQVTTGGSQGCTLMQ